MPQSSTAISSVIAVENIDRIILLVKFSWEIYLFLARFAVCKIVGVFFLFPTELATKRGITDDRYSIGDAVGKNFTNELRALH